MAAAGVTLSVNGGRCTQASVAVGGMDRAGLRLPAVEKQLVGTAVDDAQIATAAKLARAQVDPGDSYHADAEYKRELVETLVARALATARSRCK
jgi:CO/xanthine dehydrogenase FAD-binding subunit